MTAVVWICCLPDEQELASGFWSLECPRWCQQWFVCSDRARAGPWQVNVVGSLLMLLLGSCSSYHLLLKLLHLV